MPRLRKGAVPYLFPLTALGIGQNPVLPTVVSDGPEPKTSERSSGIDNEGYNEVPDETNEQPLVTPSLLTFNDVLSTEVNIPATWVTKMLPMNGTPVLAFFEPQCVKIDNCDNRYSVESIREVLLCEDMTLQVTVLKRPIKISELAEATKISERIGKIEELQDTLFAIDSFNVCKGPVNLQGKTIENSNYSAAYKDVTGTWRHKQCSLLLPHESICSFCAKIPKSINRKRRRLQKRGIVKRIKLTLPSHQQGQIAALRSRMYKAKKAAMRSEHRLKLMKEELTKCQQNLSNASITAVSELLCKNNIPANQQSVAKEIVEAAKHANAKGRRYSEQWILLCMLLHMRSPCSYEFMRSNGILPLPCVRTVRR